MNAVGELWQWARGNRRRLRVEGASMEPTLRAGQFVLVDERRPPEIGDLVVANHPRQPLIVIKRLVDIRDDGTLDLRSDNAAEGNDSRHFGTVDPGRLIGVVSHVL